MFTIQSTGNYLEPLPGIRQKTLVFGKRTLMTEFLLTEDAVLPNHAHPYEQTGYLVKGRIRLRIDQVEYEAFAGDAWCIPKNVLHGAKILEDSVAIEVFSPVREDYLPTERKNELTDPISGDSGF
jgi:quercetin dioxygenase-like cupin family protein